MAKSVVNGANLQFSYRVAQGVSALSLMLAVAAVPAQAQEAEASEAPFAEDQTAAVAETDEIVVTAQRREERLLDTPISIGVLSGEALDQSSSRSVTDALNQMGGVSLVERTPGNSQVTIRGIAADSSVGSSTTAYYLNEIPFSFITSSALPDSSAYDLARVEVLRGPQGTLFGANALSGVVRVLTNDADLDTFEAKGRARFSWTRGGGENYDGATAVNIPLVQGRIAIRGVASYSRLSGYIDSTLSSEENINDTDAQTYRIAVTMRPIDALTVRLSYIRSKVESDAPSYSFDDRTTSGSSNQPDERVYNAYNLVAEYEFAGVSLLSSTSYFDYRTELRPEILLGTFRLNYFARQELRSFAQELRLASHNEGPWNWTAGAIYKDTTERQLQRAPEAGLPFDYAITDNSQSYALFAELTRTFADGRLGLTGGLRYFHDNLYSTQQSDFFGGTTGVIAPREANFDKVTGRGVVTFRPSADQMYYASVATGFRSGLNQAPAVADVSFPALEPDTLTSYEVGAKGRAAGGVFTYDVALHYTQWDSVQQSLQVPPIGFVARVNAGRASGLGVDASVTLRPVRSLALTTSVGWSDLKFEDDVFSGANLLFARGARVNFSPEWTFSAGADYQAPLAGSGLEALISVNYSYRSNIDLRYLNVSGLNVSRSGGLSTLRASAGVEADRWSLSIFADNILDSNDRVTPPEETFDFQSVRQRPRTIGVQGSVRF